MNILWISLAVITSEPWNVSLQSLGHNVDQWFYFDKVSHPDKLLPIPPDSALLDLARSAPRDIILFCGVADAGLMPSPDTFVQLRKLCPVVMLSGDLSDPPWWPYLKAHKNSFDLVVNFDGNNNWPKCTPNDFTALTPVAHEFYPVSKPLKDRLIPFGFCGGCASPSRWEIIGWLVDNAGLQIKPREEQYGSYNRYAAFMLETAITVNVPFSGSDSSFQVKGRVLESGLARVCLLDHVSSASKNWFRPNIDYVVYETKEHAAAIVKELLSDLDRAQTFADNLHKRVVEEHSPKIFWDKVFKAVGLDNERS